MDQATRWAAKAYCTGDSQIQAFLQEPQSQGFPAWHDGSLRLKDTHDSPLSAASHHTGLSSPKEISWGDASRHQTGALLHITLLTSDDPRSKEKCLWAVMLTQLRAERWTIHYTDGTGLGGQVAA